MFRRPILGGRGDEDGDDDDDADDDANTTNLTICREKALMASSYNENMWAKELWGNGWRGQRQ